MCTSFLGITTPMFITVREIYSAGCFFFLRQKLTDVSLDMSSIELLLDTVRNQWHVQDILK